MTSNNLATPLMAGRAQEPDRQPAPIHSDALLQVSRRVDWRFLMPDPTLERVAYIGPAQGALLEALRLFSGSVTVFESVSGEDSAASPHDVVVAHHPSREALRAAARLVRPGGFLYAEVTGFRHARRDVAVLRHSGCASVQVHWHWPDFEACTRIVPLDDPVVLVGTLLKGRRGPAAWSAAALLRGLEKSKLLGWGVRHVSLLAQRETL